MSLYAFMGSVLQRLGRTNFGRKVPGDDGERVDTGVQPLADEILASLSSKAPVDLSGPLELIAPVNGPAIRILTRVYGDGGVDVNEGSLIEIVNNITNETFNITTENVTNITNVNEAPTGSTGSLQVVTGVTGSVSVSGCDVTITLNLTYATLDVQDGVIVGGV